MQYLRLGLLAALIASFGALTGSAAADSVGPITFEPTAYTIGSIGGQQGWQKTGSYDVSVAGISDYALIGSYGFGTQALRASDDITSGSFGDQTFAPKLTSPSSETSNRHFEASFSIGTALAAAEDGLHMSVSPDNGQGARMSYLRFEEQADGLVHVFFDDASDNGLCSPAGCANFTDTDITQFAPGSVHTFRFVIDLVPGTAAGGGPNDVVKIYEDGALKVTGTSWESYYRYDPESGPRTVMPSISTLLFRESGTANPADADGGFLIDDVSLASSNEPVSGSWQLDAPTVVSAYKAVVQQPINPDGTSSWPAKRGVIPVKFQLQTQSSQLFESIGSDSATDNDSSSLSFTPSGSVYVGDITNLAATYTFSQGDCHGGALRWSIATPVGNVFVYYGATPNFTDCTTVNQSGVNMLATGDLRVDTSQVGGTFYDSWAHALSLVGGQPVSGISLVLDGGWGGNQIVTLASTSVNENNWATAAPGGFTPTCTLPPAAIVIQKDGDANPIPADEILSVSAADTGGMFRVSDCNYLYNLSTASLSGVGSYKVWPDFGDGNVGEGIFGLK